MKIVVTGSQGFIGGYIVNELLRRGHEVIGIDNYSKYGKLPRSYDNNKNFKLLYEDLSRSNLVLKQALVDADHLIAGAAKIGGISYFHTYSYDLLAENERIMANTCDAAIEAHNKGKLQKLSYLSSSMVYENTDRWPSKEGDQCLIPPPSSSYGFQKLAVEYFARAAWDQYKLPYTIIRIFNCVGVGEARAANAKIVMSGEIKLALSHVLPDLVQKVLRGQNPLRLLGNGQQIRHLTYGGDLAKGVYTCMTHPKALNDDFNLSTAKSHTMLELGELVWKKIKGNTPFRYEFDEPFIHDVQKRIPDTSKARNVLGFEATTTIEEVLDEVIPWVTTAVANNLI